MRKIFHRILTIPVRKINPLQYKAFYVRLWNVENAIRCTIEKI